MKNINLFNLFIVPVFLIFFTDSYSQSITFQRTYGYSIMDMFSNVQQTIDNGFIMCGTSMENMGITTSGSVIKTLPDGNLSWGKNLNGVTIDNPWPFPDVDDDCSFMINYIRQTSDNGYILTGQISPSLTSLYVNYTDLVLVKLNTSGAVTWAYHYGGTESDIGNVVMQTSDGGYLVAGSTKSFSAKDSLNIFILKTSSTGALTWEKTVQVSSVDDDAAVTVEEVSDGYIIGGYTEQVNGPDTLSDMVLIKTNKTTGAVTWLKTYGADSDDEKIFDVSLSTAGNLLVTGYTGQSGFNNTLLMKVDISNGNIVSSTSYFSGMLSLSDEGHSIQNTNDGGISIIGFSMSLFGANSILLKTDASGNTVTFSKSYNNGFAGMQFFSSGHQTGDGGYIIGNMGPGAAAWDFGLIKTDANGSSGCNEDNVTPSQDACTFAVESPAQTTFSGASATSIAVIVSDITITDGIMCCTPLPDNAGTVTGLATVCQGQSGVIYTVPAIANATGYTWTLPAGSGITSGANTNTITVDFSVSATSGTITVMGTNQCGNSAASSLNVTVNSIPSDAGVISGPASVCQGQTGVSFTVPVISGAVNYQWAVPSGATIASGSGTNSIAVDFSSGAVSGNITVYGSNSCGNGSTSSYAVTVETLPSAAGSISGTSPVCQGNSGIVFSVPAIVGATGYTWSVPAGAVITNGANTNTVTIDFSGTASSGTISVFGTNLCGNGSPSSFDVIVNSIPATPVDMSGDNTVCQTDTGIVYLIPLLSGATGYAWTVPSGAVITSGQNTTSISVNFSDTAVSGNISVYGTNTCGNGTSMDYPVTVSFLPGAAGMINGPDTVCQAQSNVTFNISSITGAATYNWSLPPGAVIISGSGTDSITVNFSPTAGTGNISVYATNFCGTGDSSFIPVFVALLPDSAASITGNSVVCQGDTNVTYSVPAVPGATGYSWTLPSGASISGNDTSNSVTVSFSDQAVSGNISVAGVNSCGQGVPSIIPVTVNILPQAPGSISGDNTVCQTDTGITYTVPPITGATGYVWTVPSGAIISSGQNTDTIIVNFSDTAASGDITVYGTNSCGNGSPATFPVTLSFLPGNAGLINGSDTVCQAQAGISYTIPAITGATSYHWNLPPGATISSGAGTDSIIVNFSSTASAGNISVYASNVCGTGDSSFIPVSVLLLPDTAGIITGKSVVCQGDTNVTYSVPPVPGATGYLWTLPSGASISGNDTSNSVTISFSDQAVSGIISVRGVNNCGNGVSSSLAVIVNILPQMPGNISGDNQVCQGETGVIYSVPVITGATSYSWTIPFGAAITNGVNSDSITVQFSDSAVSGNISVFGVNSCGYGDTAVFPVNVTALPDKAGIIMGTATLCAGETGVTYSIPPVSGAAGYQWDLPAGDSITAGAGTNSITVDFTSGASSGIISVYGINSCGSGDTSARNITVNPIPSFIISKTDIKCHGEINGTAWPVFLNDVVPVSFNWSNGSTNDTITGLSQGLYVLIVTDTNGCQNDSIVNIIEPPDLTILISGSNTLCHNTNDGSAIVSVAGGTTPYTYTWSDNNTTHAPAVTGLSPDIYYYIVVIDKNLCIAEDSILVTSPAEILTGITGTTPATCYGGQDGAAVIWSSGGTGTRTYSWSGRPDITGPAGTGLGAGTYLITVTDDNACSDTISLNISQAAMINAVYQTDSTSCIDADDGKIILHAYGGMPPYSYNWSEALATDSILANLHSGTYSVTITDSRQCTETRSAIVYASPEVCLEIPTAFTPNQDSNNDTWEIKGIQFYPQAQVVIYNRWGQIIFESKGYNTPWDGKYKNNDVSSGPYVFILNLNNGSDPYQGIVTIIR